jgi:hypothetical protein
MVRGFQASTTVVVFVLLFGTVLAYFHGAPGKSREPTSPSTSLEASGDG